jgi:hypothetical protein
MISEPLTYKQAAALLAVPIGTVYAWVHQKRIPHFRISGRCVRFDRAELLCWLDSQRVPVAPLSERAGIQGGAVNSSGGIR